MAVLACPISLSQSDPIHISLSQMPRLLARPAESLAICPLCWHSNCYALTRVERTGVNFKGPVVFLAPVETLRVSEIASSGSLVTNTLLGRGFASGTRLGRMQWVWHSQKLVQLYAISNTCNTEQHVRRL